MKDELDIVVRYLDTYAKLGWHVLPLHSVVDGRCTCGDAQCGSPGKHPLTPHGFHDASADRRQIARWLAHWPKCNWGLAVRASGLLILDVDTKNNGFQTLANILRQTNSKIPLTVIAKTGSGGQHIYFRLPYRVTKFPPPGALGPGLDVPHLVVLPPSEHKQGTYEWIFSPENTEIAECPDWLIEKILETENQPKNKKSARKSQKSNNSETPNLDELINLPQGIRNDTIFRAGCADRALGASDAAIHDAVLRAARACNPPLSEREAETIARSICRYPRGEPRPQVRLDNNDNDVDDIVAGVLEIRKIQKISKQVESLKTDIIPKILELDESTRKIYLQKISKILKIPVKLLRELIDEVGAEQNLDSSFAALFEPVPEYDASVTLVEVLDDLRTYFDAFVELPKDGSAVLALWTFLTWVYDEFDRLPIVLLQSPAPQSGKTTACIALAEVVRRPLSLVSITPAALFRVVSAVHPTIILDEADKTFKDNEELTALVNASHTRRLAKVVRCDKETLKPQVFDVFCPIAISGNNPYLAAATYDRMIDIRLLRRNPRDREKYLPAREDTIRNYANEKKFRAKLNKLSKQLSGKLSVLQPEIPSELSDRQADCWQPLLVLAEIASPEWSALTRRLAIEYSRNKDDEFYSIIFLQDLAKIFSNNDLDRATPQYLLDELKKFRESPWTDDFPLTVRKIIRILKSFGIEQVRFRVGAERRWGYTLAQLTPIFERYIPQFVAELNSSTSDNLDDNDPEIDDFVSRIFKGGKK